MAGNVWAISIPKIFSKFPTAGHLVIWEPWPAVDLLQFLIKCQHPRLRTLRPTWIVADSYKRNRKSPDLSVNMKISEKKKEFRP